MGFFHKKIDSYPITEDCTNLKKYNELGNRMKTLLAESPQETGVREQGNGYFYEKTLGILKIPYKEWLELMPPFLWGINQADYLGGELKVLKRDELGRVIYQRERMLLKTTGSWFLKFFIKTLPMDLTKVERIRYLKNETIIEWSAYYSNNGSVKIDDGFLRFSPHSEYETKVEFLSKHQVRIGTFFEKFYLARKVFHTILKKELHRIFKNTITQYEEIAKGSLDPKTLYDYSYHGRNVWKNWARNIKAPMEVLKPSNLQELSSYVKNASKNKAKIRVVGAGHSWSPITALHRGFLISLDKMNQILWVNEEKKQVKVEAGIRLFQLNEKLAKLRLGLSVLGTIDRQSIAGVISTGTHGTGIQYPPIHHLVVEIDLMDAEGNIQTCSREKNPELFMAAACGVGTMGIITAVTLQCESLFHLKQERYLCSLTFALEKLESLYKENEHVKLWWFPYTKEVLVTTQNRTFEPKKRNLFYKWYTHYFSQYVILQLTIFFAALLPLELIKKINQKGLILLPKRNSHVDESYEIFHFPLPVRHFEAEFSIPIEHAKAALMDLIRAVEEGDFKISFPCVEIRFVKGDDVYLSPAFGRDSCYIGIFQSLFSPKEKYFQKVEKVMDQYGGRPHWGKMHHKNSLTLPSLYPQWDSFIAVQRKMDPHEVFMNSYEEELFLPPTEKKE